MPILESQSTPEGTHPSRASSLTSIQCDKCGTVFHADCCIDDQWQLHGQPVGATDGADELCAKCVKGVFGDV